MAATVYTGRNQNFTYTNSTGGNVRLIIYWLFVDQSAGADRLQMRWGASGFSGNTYAETAECGGSIDFHMGKNCIVSNNNDTTRINWEKHFYHNKFDSSAHPNFLYDHANRFLQFLDRNCDEIQDFRENNDKGYLNINIKLIKERYDTTRTNIVVPID